MQGEQEGLLGPQEKEEVMLRFPEGQILFCWEKDHWGPAREEEIFGDQRQRKYNGDTSGFQGKEGRWLLCWKGVSGVQMKRSLRI